VTLAIDERGVRGRPIRAPRPAPVPARTRGGLWYRSPKPRMRTALLVSLAFHAGLGVVLALLHFARSAEEPAAVLAVSIRSDAIPAFEPVPPDPLLSPSPVVAEAWPAPQEEPTEPEIEAPAVAGVGGFRMPDPVRLAKPLPRPRRAALPPEPPVVPVAAAPRHLTARALPVREPRLLPDSPAPDYPTRARRMGLEGTVVLLLHVAADGTVASVEIASSSGHEILDRAAAEAAADRWRFEPARRGSLAVAKDVRGPVEFKLTDA